jgi:hypothetical protein
VEKILACTPRLTRVAGIISISSRYDRPRLRSTAVGQNAYPARLPYYLEYDLGDQWVPVFGFRHVDIVRHTIGSYGVQEMEITFVSPHAGKRGLRLCFKIPTAQLAAESPVLTLKLVREEARVQETGFLV